MFGAHIDLEAVMPTDTSLRETLTHFRDQEKKLIEELGGVRQTVRSLERALGIENQTTDNPNASEPVTIDVTVPSMSGAFIGGKPTIRPDEFFGVTQAEAARKYLQKVGHAVSFDELADALRKGGCKLSGANAKQVLYISLIRNTRDFVPPQPGFVGLREFYPGGGGRSAPERTRHKKRRQVARAKKTPKAPAEKRKTVPVPAAELKTNGGPAELPRAVREFMSDKQSHSAKEIAEAVGKKLGRQIIPVAIQGVLRSKAFGRIDGKYRLLS